MKFLFALLVAVLSCLALTNAAKSGECLLPMAKSGDGQIQCMGYMPSWTYDAKENKCVEFIYGGCHGNANRFASEGTCKSVCVE